MKIESAKNINRLSNWKMIIYAKPGTGKTSLIKNLTGNTLVLDLDNSSRVLAGLDNVGVIEVNRSKIEEEITSFLKEIKDYVASNDIQNVVIDNISSFEKDWFIEIGRKSHNGISNELQDYSKWTNYFARVLTEIYSIPNVNILVTAWETTRDITSPTGQQFSQYAPEIRQSVRDGLLGLSDVVGRLIVNPKTNGRGVILQGNDAIFAKNRLDNRKLCNADQLFNVGNIKEATKKTEQTKGDK